MNFFLFGVYPYIAVTVFLVGTIMRFRLSQYGWTAESSQLLEKDRFRMMSNLFHISIILLFITHIAGLLTPPWLYGLLISHKTKQLLAIFVGGFFGIVCLIATTLLIIRRLSSPRVRMKSHVIDLLMMVLLYAVLVIGVSTLPFSYQHLDGDNLAELAAWAQHLVTFQSDTASFMADKQFIFKLHVFLGMTLFIVFPFSRLVHILSLPIGYLFRSYTQIVRSK